MKKYMCIFLTCVSLLFAVDEIPVDYTSGETLYACRFDGPEVFFTNGSGTEDWSTVANYIVTMTENGTGGHYVGNFDTSANISDGIYQITVYHQIGGSPADSDPAIYVGEIIWKDGAEYDPVAEFNARTKPSADYFDFSVDTVKLASDGLDSVSTAEPGYDVSQYTYRDMMHWLFGRWANKTIWDSVGAQAVRLRNAADDGDLTSQSLDKTGNVQTVGEITDGAAD